jgi:predicted RNase H-like HicB family nuclease
MPTPQSNQDQKMPDDPSRYPVEVFYSDADEGYIAIARDLPGCSAFGKTQAEAIAEIHGAIRAWQRAAIEAGNPVPWPSQPAEEVSLPSGKILLRLPRTLHGTLIECAKNEGVSLNQYLVYLLSYRAAALQTEQTPALISQATLSVPPRFLRTWIQSHYSELVLAKWEAAETVVRAVDQLDVRSLPANVPVIREVR